MNSPAQKAIVPTQSDVDNIRKLAILADRPVLSMQEFARKNALTPMELHEVLMVVSEFRAQPTKVLELRNSYNISFPEVYALYEVRDHASGKVEGAGDLTLVGLAELVEHFDDLAFDDINHLTDILSELSSIFRFRYANQYVTEFIEQSEKTGTTNAADLVEHLLEMKHGIPEEG